MGRTFLEIPEISVTAYAGPVDPEDESQGRRRYQITNHMTRQVVTMSKYAYDYLIEHGKDSGLEL